MKSLAPRKTINRKQCDVKRDKFDNAAAVEFLSRPLRTDEGKHFRKFGKTKTVHLQVRNDYTPPRNNLTLYGDRGLYRCHAAGDY